MDSGTISGIVTVVFIIVFMGIVWWAYSKGNKQQFEDASRLACLMEWFPYYYFPPEKSSKGLS